MSHHLAHISVAVIVGAGLIELAVLLGLRNINGDSEYDWPDERTA